MMKPTSLFLSGCALLAGSVSPMLQAEIHAGFTDHTDIGTLYDTSNNTGQASAVDQYGGTVGGGWSSGWQVYTAGGSGFTREKQVLNSSPVNGGGNYLSISSDSTSTSSPRWGVYREYDGAGTSVDLSQTLTYSFDYRFDDTSFFEGGGASFVQIMEGAEWIWNTSTATWAIGTSSTADPSVKYWSVGDGNGTGGASFINTNLQMNQGDTYSFLITSNPGTMSWDVSITNLDAPMESYSNTGLGYALNQSSHGGSLWFNQQATDESSVPGTRFEASIDNIAIIPEPSTFLLLGLALGGFLCTRRRH